MEKLLDILKTMPPYATLLRCAEARESAAISGIGQISRSHIIAGLRQHQSAPMVILVQDDMAARRLQEELKAFLGETAPILPSRELTLYDASVVSRAWEQKRLRQLYDLHRGRLMPVLPDRAQAMGPITAMVPQEVPMAVDTKQDTTNKIKAE